MNLFRLLLERDSAAVRPGQIAEFPHIGDAGLGACRKDLPRNKGPLTRCMPASMRP